MCKNKKIPHLKFFEDNKIALIYLKESDFKECDIDSTHSSFGLVDICINIEKVEIGILISEIKHNLYACSIRGKGNVDVSEIASAFGGGGHKKASGASGLDELPEFLRTNVRSWTKLN